VKVGEEFHLGVRIRVDSFGFLGVENVVGVDGIVGVEMVKPVLEDGDDEGGGEDNNSEGDLICFGCFDRRDWDFVERFESREGDDWGKSSDFVIDSGCCEGTISEFKWFIEGDPETNLEEGDDEGVEDDDDDDDDDDDEEDEEEDEDEEDDVFWKGREWREAVI
jgi:hypothetical protein